MWNKQNVADTSLIFMSEMEVKINTRDMTLTAILNLVKYCEGITFGANWCCFTLLMPLSQPTSLLVMFHLGKAFHVKGSPSDLGTNILKNTRKSSLYSKSLLIFIHRTQVVERHPITRKIRDLLWPRLTPTGNTVYFYMSSSFIYTMKIHRWSFKHSFRWRYYGK